MTGLLERGVHVAPYTSLCHKRVLLAIGAGGVLLASVVLREDADEATVVDELERLVRLYEPA